jgi:hypothetical protein
MNQNGVDSEAQIFFGAVIKFHKAHQKDRDMPFKIEEVLQRQKSVFRRLFFEEFVESKDEFSSDWEFEACISNLLSDPPLELLQKGSAWYISTYRQHDDTLKSFPWIIYEVLVLIRKFLDSQMQKINE